MFSVAVSTAIRLCVCWRTVRGGERDRRLFEEWSARKGDRVTLWRDFALPWHWRVVTTWSHDPDVRGYAMADARPGEHVEVLTEFSEVLTCQVAWRPRLLETALAAGGHYMPLDR